LPAMFAMFVFLLLAAACHKNAVPTDKVLSEEDKKALLAKVRADGLFVQWRANQDKGFETMKMVVRSAMGDTARLNAVRNAGKQADYYGSLKKAGLLHVEELEAINNRSMELLKELWQKYPQLNQFSAEEIGDLGKRNINRQKP
jgi:hypothetical protein